jgi:hypothetical protein
MRKDPPRPAEECPEVLPQSEQAVIEEALHARHGQRLRPGETINIDVRTGLGSAAATVTIGSEHKAHEVHAFVRDLVDLADTDSPYTAALSFVLDELDAILQQLVGSDDHFLPLDFEGRPSGDAILYVRGEVRDYRAEREAARLLGEDAPERPVPWRPRKT